LNKFYLEHGDEPPYPETIDLVHPVEAITRVLSILEAVSFAWTVNQVLEQDESWLDDILLMKAIGEQKKREVENNG